MPNIIEVAHISGIAKESIVRIFGPDVNIHKLLEHTLPPQLHLPYTYKVENNGVLARVKCVKNKNSSIGGKSIYILDVVPIEESDKLKDYAYLGYWGSPGDDACPPFLEEVASLALPECWTDKNLPQRGKFNLLLSYLSTTFSYIYRKNGYKLDTSDDGEYSAFNSGLVDKVYDDIYIVFKHRPKGLKPNWEYLYCTTERKNTGKIMDTFSKKPKRAKYSDIDQLFLDPSDHVISDFEHIFEDNFERFPMTFIENELSPVSEFKAYIEQTRSQEELITFILSNDECYRRINDAYENVVKQAIRKWKWNYKTAVPIFFPTTNSIQFLLPLTFNRDSDSFEAALVIDRTNRELEYRGVTILTPSMAYLDARLLCRPDSYWLRLKEDE